LDFPKDDNTFLEVIARSDPQGEPYIISNNDILFHRKSRQYNVTVSDIALDELKAASAASGLVKSVRQAFQLATSVSPLLALVPKKYNAKSVNFKREALVAVSCQSLT
jgi:hypothetical protein